jgi:hypothetical protein
MSHLAPKDEWAERGDGCHWDHPDGCFIEKEHSERFVLYTGKCVRLARVCSLRAAYQKHADLKRLNPEAFKP